MRVHLAALCCLSYLYSCGNLQVQQPDPFLAHSNSERQIAFVLVFLSLGTGCPGLVMYSISCPCLIPTMSRNINSLVSLKD